jgi:hypothetical protein
LHFACVEYEEKLGKKFFSFWLKMAPLAQGVGQRLFFCHNFGSIQLFFNLFFALLFCYQHTNLMEEKFLIKSKKTVETKKLKIIRLL